MNKVLSSVSVLVPVYNEALALRATVEQLRDVLDTSGLVGEIIVVDDGSTDDSSELECDADRVRLLQHSTNRGYGAALKTGMQAARHATIVIVDADGTYPVAAIPDLVSKLADYDMVVGARTGQQVQYSLLRKIPKAFLKTFAEWITGRSIPDLNSGLRVFRRSEAVRFQRLLPDRFSFTTTITVAMLTSGLRVHFEPIDYSARVGRSKFRPVRDTWNMAVTILRLGVYFAPLKVFLPVAACLGLIGTLTLAEDVFVRQDLTERTLVLWMATMQVGLLALLADLIVRSRN